MLSIFSRIKNKIRNFVKNKNLPSRLRNYNVVIGNEIISVDINNSMVIDENEEIDEYNDVHVSGSASRSGTGTETGTLRSSKPTHTRRLFNIEVDETVVKHDYELQELLKMMQIYQIDVKNITLESRFENAVNNIHNASDIIKIKMKLLYIIIANNLYRSLFEEKKQYRSTKNNQYVGVFRYNDYIIRIDDCPYSFINEADVIKATAGFSENNNIVRPFLMYMNIRYNLKTKDICDCRQPYCECIYTDIADIADIPSTVLKDDSNNDNNEVNYDTSGNQIARACFDKLRKNTVSFSIQYYVKDTVSLYTWVRENLCNDVYNRFSSMQYTFFIHLFYKCAKLLRDIHNVSVVHGDIKPDNILIREHSNFNINHPEKCKNFTVYLIDFGLSGIHNIGIGTGGTIPYCHPEFKNIVDTDRSSKYNWKILDVKHDVWSLGVLFLTMYIYRDFYNYYHKYPNYFFLKDGYVSSLIIDVITDARLNELFGKMLTPNCISSQEVCDILQNVISSPPKQ